MSIIVFLPALAVVPLPYHLASVVSWRHCSPPVVLNWQRVPDRPRAQHHNMVAHRSRLLSGTAVPVVDSAHRVVGGMRQPPAVAVGPGTVVAVVATAEVGRH